MKLFAGLDVGTSGCRCLIVDERGRRTGYGERRWEYEREGPALVTLDGRAARAKLVEAVHEAMATCSRQSVVGIGVTSQRTGVVLLADDGEELAVLPNADGRAAAEGIEQERAHGEAIYRIAGRLPAMLYLPARLEWFRRNRPDVLGRARHALSLGDWICHALTGRAATDPTQAAETLVYDVAKGDWSDELLEKLAVPRALLPDLLPAGEPAGALTPQAAALFGFWPGTDVVPAGGDTPCAALGMGVTSPGAASVVAGTTMLCGHVRADPAIDPGGRFWTSPHPAGGFVQEAHCGEAGSAIEWFAGLMGIGAADLVDAAAKGQPGAGGAMFVDPLPSTATDFSLLRPGAFVFPAPVLALGRPREDVARAVIEGIAFGARWGLDLLREENGEPADLAVAGGVARSDVFLAALAGASDRVVRAPTETASSALGAAICAAAPQLGGVPAAAEAMADRGRDVAPDPSHGYPAHYAAWRARAEEVAAHAMRVRGLIT